MATSIPITGLPVLAPGSVQSDDLLPIVDVHDLTDPTGTTKQVTIVGLQQAGSILNGMYNVLNYAAPGVVINTGVNDATSAFAAMTSAAPIGARMLVPPGTYLISGDVVLGKAGQQLILQGATINSNVGRFIPNASNTLIDGCDLSSTINYISGPSASSLNRAVRVSGSFNGSLLPITGSITRGAFSFVATNAGDVSALVPGSWLIVGEFNSDWQRQEWKQVLSVSGTTVNVTTAFRQTFNTYTRGFYSVTRPLEDVTVRGLQINTSDVVIGSIGVDAQLCRNFTLENCRINVAYGEAFFLYLHDAPTVTKNLVDRQFSFRMAISACCDGYVGYNRVDAVGAVPVNGGLTVETGTCFTTFDSNELPGTAGSGVIGVQWADSNVFRHNTVTSDGTAIGLYILGGDNNISTGNHFQNVLDGIRVNTDVSVSPARTATGNTSIGDMVRTATGSGIHIVTNVVNASIYLLDTDASVVAPIFDAGTGTSILYRDPTSGLMNINPLLPASTILQGAATSGLQLVFGSSSVLGSVGIRYSGTDAFLAQNATQAIGSDLWTQSVGTVASKLLILRVNGAMEFYNAVIGRTAGTFATFWGSPVFSVSAAGAVSMAAGLTVTSATLLASLTSFTNGAGASAGTLTNAPAVGNPTKWIPVNDNGTTRYLPAW